MQWLKRNFKVLLPPHTRRYVRVRGTLETIGLIKPLTYTDAEYNSWLQEVEAKQLLGITHNQKPCTPNLSIVIPCWNTQKKYLDQLMESILNQTYTDWELILVDVSDDMRRSEKIHEWSSKDIRCKYLKLKKNYDISTNTNKGIESAHGEYIVFADHDDILSATALAEIAKAIIENDRPDIIYSDEDKVTDDGKVRHSPYFKPGWSPNLFWFTNYTNHLSIIKKELIMKVGGLDPSSNGSQDYDLLLRIHQHFPEVRVHHIPKILYHWREAEGSTATNHDNKMYAFEAARKSLSSFFSRSDIDADVEYIENSPGFYKEVFKAPKSKAKIQIKDFSGDLEAIKSRLIDQTNTKHDMIFHDEDIEDYDYEVNIIGNFSPCVDTWLDELIGVASLGSVATVSPRIIDANKGIVIDAGIVHNAEFSGFESYEGLGVSEHTPTGGTWWVRDSERPSNYVFVRKNSSKVHVKTPGTSHVIWSHVDFTKV